MIDEKIIQRLRENPSAVANAIATDLTMFNKIAVIDPLSGIIRLRRALDLIIRSVASSNDIAPGTKPLEQLLQEIGKKNSMPRLVQNYCRVVKEFGNFAAHGQEDSSFSEPEQISIEETEMCSHAIVNILIWFEGKLSAIPVNDSPYLIISGSQISEEHLKQAVEIDHLNYPAEYSGILETCITWHKRNPDIYTMILDRTTRNVVGYINAMPLSDDYLERILAGNTLDTDIPEEQICTFDFPDRYRLYFSSIGIHPSYQSPAAFRSLYNAFIEKLGFLAKQEIFFSEIIADAVTPEGHRLCLYAGMNEIKKSKHNSTIYRIDLIPPKIRVTTKAGEALVMAYKQLS
jgi:hypothetical protein